MTPLLSSSGHLIGPTMFKTFALAVLLAVAVAPVGESRAQVRQADAPGTVGGRMAASVEVSVRMMRAEEVKARLGDHLLPPEAVGLFLVPQAMVTATTSDAVLATTIGPPGGAEFEPHARTVLSQLSAGSLATDLAGQLKALMGAAALEAGDVWDFEVALAYFGLRSEAWRPGVQSESDSYCLVAGGAVNVGGLHGLQQTSAFRRGVDDRSDGMPEPECRPLTEFSSNGGLKLRQAMRDMAAVLAAWIANRSLDNR